MVKGKAELHVLTEYSPYAMGLVIITPSNKAIIIDGGRPTEEFNVKAHVGNRDIAAWILTHTHGDHVSCLSGLISKKDPMLDRVECFISNFHTPEFFRSVGSEGEAQFVEKYKNYIETNGKKLIEPVKLASAACENYAALKDISDKLGGRVLNNCIYNVKNIGDRLHHRLKHLL